VLDVNAGGQLHNARLSALPICQRTPGPNPKTTPPKVIVGKSSAGYKKRHLCGADLSAYPALASRSPSCERAAPLRGQRRCRKRRVVRCGEPHRPVARRNHSKRSFLFEHSDKKARQAPGRLPPKARPLREGPTSWARKASASAVQDSTEPEDFSACSVASEKPSRLDHCRAGRQSRLTCQHACSLAVGLFCGRGRQGDELRRSGRIRRRLLGT
jgi:hypothetical protein